MSWRGRGLLFVPAAAVLVLLCGLGIADDDVRRRFYRCDILVVKTLATFGCFYAASAFHRGDYLRRAWSFYAAGLGLLVLIDLFYAPPIHTSVTRLTTSHQLLRGTIVLLSNAASVVAIWMLARAWSQTGLPRTGSRAWRRVVDGAFVVVTLAIVGPSLYTDTRALWHGNLQGYAAVASDHGDLFCLALIAPLMRTALELRGGALVWPWILLTAAEVSWLFYDATGVFADALHVQPARIAPEEIFRTLACTFAFVGGLAQRWVITAGARRRA